MPGVRLSLLVLAPLATALGLGACATDSTPTGPVDQLPAPATPVEPTLDVSSPSPNTWLTRTAMPTARAGLVAATVNNKVYVIGGRNPNTFSSAKVEMFMPGGSLVSWASKASLPSGRSWPSGAATINGKIYVTGGFSPNGARTRTLYVYNPATNLWSSKPQMPVPTAQGASAVIDGRLYVLTPPASMSDPQKTQLHRYDPGANEWVSRATAPVNLQDAVVGVINGKLYAAGGLDTASTPLGVTYAYDPSTNVWSKRASMPIPRRAAAGLALGGKLYAIGGNGGSGLYGNTQVFTPGSGWTMKASMPTPRYVATAAAAGGWIYVIGGIPTNAFSAVGTNEAYVP
jgi:N-acetylneuraminic acid mutarotase